MGNFFVVKIWFSVLGGQAQNRVSSIAKYTQRLAPSSEMALGESDQWQYYIVLLWRLFYPRVAFSYLPYLLGILPYPSFVLSYWSYPYYLLLTAFAYYLPLSYPYPFLPTSLSYYYIIVCCSWCCSGTSYAAGPPAYWNSLELVTYPYLLPPVILYNITMRFYYEVAALRIAKAIQSVATRVWLVGGLAWSIII